MTTTLPSFDRIDPSNHIMIKKGSDMNTLINETRRAKTMTYVMAGFTFTLVLAIIAYQAFKTTEDEEKPVY